MTSTLLKDIGGRISKRRKELGLTQEQIADKMNVSVQMISNLERGNKAIRIDNLINISNLLEVSTDYILTGKITQDNISDLFNKMSALNREDYDMIRMLVEYCSNKS